MSKLRVAGSMAGEKFFQSLIDKSLQTGGHLLEYFHSSSG